jgi:hypothetical protein
MAAMPTPITPPMMECVVDTGMENRVAIVSHTEDPITAHTIPSMRTEGSDSKSLVEMTLVRIVSVTSAPTAMAPANSIHEAIIMACFSVRDRDATDVANELATSLAPIVRVVGTLSVCRHVAVVTSGLMSIGEGKNAVKGSFAGSAEEKY